MTPNGRQVETAGVSEQRTTTGLVVQPLVRRDHFSGPEGARTLPNESRLQSFDVASFEAEICSVRLGDLTLRRTTITPHRAVVGGRERGKDAAMLRLVMVRNGTVFAAPPGGDPVRFDVGDSLFACDSRPYIYQTNAPLVSVVTTLPVSRLPATAPKLQELPIGPLPHTPLVDALVGLLFNLADRLDEPWDFDAGYAAQGVIDLQVAILIELVGPTSAARGTERVYRAALAYIDRHLAEPELRPPQIADALGVSVRYLHHAFADKDATVARYLRQRRLEQVATILHTRAQRPSLNGLATRFGFTSQEQLARAFRQEYNVSMTEYRGEQLPTDSEA